MFSHHCGAASFHWYARTPQTGAGGLPEDHAVLHVGRRESGSIGCASVPIKYLYLPFTTGSGGCCSLVPSPPLLICLSWLSYLNRCYRRILPGVSAGLAGVSPSLLRQQAVSLSIASYSHSSLKTVDHTCGAGGQTPPPQNDLFECWGPLLRVGSSF